MYHLQHAAPTAEQHINATPIPGPQLPLAHPLPVLCLAKRHPRHGAGGVSHGTEPDLLCHSNLGALYAAQGLVLAHEVDNSPLVLADASVLDPRPHGDGAHAAASAKVADVLHDRAAQGRKIFQGPKARVSMSFLLGRGPRPLVKE